MSMNSDIKVWYLPRGLADYKPGMDLGPPHAIQPAPSYVSIKPGSTIKQTPPAIVKQPVMEKPRKSRSKYPIEIIKQLEENGIDHSVFVWRISKGWTIEKASTTPPMTARERGAMGGKNSVESRKKKAVVETTNGEEFFTETWRLVDIIEEYEFRYDIW